MAPQSPLEESATTEASRMWHGNGQVRWSYCSKNPFIECSFHEITIEFLLELVQKAACKKLNRYRQTNKQTESSRYRARPWPCFGQFTRRYHSQMPPKPVPKTTLGFLLTSRLKSELSGPHTVGTILGFHAMFSNHYFGDIDQSEGFYCAHVGYL